MDKWPNFFIVGAPRAGTTTLYEFLNQTKRVYMSPKKELHYFSQSLNPSHLTRPTRDKTKYLKLFNKVTDETAIGEASTSYLYDPKASELIHKTVPNAKIIISLRDPVERAYSNYLQRVGSGKTYSFSEAIQQALNSKDNFYNGVIVQGGWYYNEVKRYLELFGKENVKILIFEEFIQNPKKTAKEVLEFLGVNEEPPESIELLHNLPTKPRGKLATTLLQSKKLRKFGKLVLSGSTELIIAKQVLGKKITKPEIAKKDRDFLENLYSDDAKNLQKILKKKMPWKWIEKYS